MAYLQIKNKIIHKSIIDILQDIRKECNTGKLSVIKPNGDYCQVTCPNPEHKGGHEAKPSGGVYLGKDLDKQPYYHCFTCQTACSFDRFVAMCFDWPVEKADQWLIENYADESLDYAIELPEITLVQNKPLARHWSTEGLIDFHPYMATRKLSPEICTQFEVKYDPKDSCLVFPFYDCHNKFLGVTKRSVHTKWFYIDPAIDKENNLYLYYNLKKTNATRCAITEAQIDALTSYGYGLPAVATLGGISKAQIDLINHSGIRTLYSIFDNDFYGHRFTTILKKFLNPEILLIEVQFPAEYKDINDTSKEMFWQSIKNAETNCI